MNLLQMDKVYEELPFDNPDGGAWKQGWDVQYDQNEVLKPENKLKVCHLRMVVQSTNLVGKMVHFFLIRCCVGVCDASLAQRPWLDQDV